MVGLRIDRGRTGVAGGGRCVGGSGGDAGQGNDGDCRRCGGSTHCEDAAARPRTGNHDVEMNQPSHRRGEVIRHEVSPAPCQVECFGLVANKVQHLISTGPEDHIAIINRLNVEVFAECECHRNIPLPVSYAARIVSAAYAILAARLRLFGGLLAE